MKPIPFHSLSEADLVVDAVYQGGSQKHMGADPINPLVGGGNQGGFRYEGSLKKRVKFCILYSMLNDPDWPDTLDATTGTFVYYGDNKEPGHQLHDTPRNGNLILNHVFDALHLGKRADVPPILVFTKGAKGRDVVFRGLVVPGGAGVPQSEDLVAIWRSKAGQRFQNYKAIFTVLDAPTISRTWIKEGLQAEKPDHSAAPLAWLKWLKGGTYEALRAPRVTRIRSKQEQLPADEHQAALLKTLWTFFDKHPDGKYAFEPCAVELVRMLDPNFEQFDLTRPWRDGGRDAVGTYRVGEGDADLLVDCALEAKCYGVNNGCGVRLTSRLISRLRHRQFGVFVTTSYVADQAYKELVDDGHPVMVVAGSDICRVLIAAGYDTPASVESWLTASFSGSKLTHHAP